MLPIDVSGFAARNPEISSTMEWMVSNGLGGFASGTVAGINTRRYHGVLLTAPQIESRFLLVAQVQEELTLDGNAWYLGATCYQGTIDPKGYQHLLRFMLYPYPTWIYAGGSWLLEKSLTMVRLRNVTVIRYHLIAGPTEVELRIRPFLAGRHYHATQHEGNGQFSVQTGRVWQRVQGPDSVSVTWLAGSGTFEPHDVWYRGILYPREAERGLDHKEDLLVPGVFTIRLRPGEQGWLVVAGSEPSDDSSPLDEPAGLVENAFRDVELRQERLLAKAGSPQGVAGNLVMAADAFIVRRQSNVSVIAGYPWFTDWGRDAMIALPGLFLATGRSAEAHAVLTTFAEAEHAGLIPNRFPDQSLTPEYNTVDAALWFVYACFKYVQYTGDAAGLRDIWPAIKSIITSYRSGTLFGIGVDSKGLVRSGQAGYQLTWMDAKVGEWVVTPREGYPVEISALWYNALHCAAHLGRCWDPGFSSQCKQWAEETARSFLPTFWLPDRGYLADLINDNGQVDESLRPNQLLAVSLPYPILEGHRARSVVRRAWEELYTPMGLRSLSPLDPHYHPVYSGDQYARDSAYHRGTVWGWLIGPFVTAYRQALGRTAHSEAVARAMIAPILDHLWEAGLGQISEVFDGNSPHKPGGCFAQAWSVAEILRLWVEEFGRRSLP